MRVAIGLPNPVPHTPGPLLVEWARRADARGFSSLATIDRVAYPSYESLVALAAAAGATERIALFTNVLLAPTRDPVLLAKQAASVAAISGGRLTLGVAVGGRPDDYAVTARQFDRRGRDLDRFVRLLHVASRGDALAGTTRSIVPDLRAPIPLFFGGTSDATIRRVARWGVGWTAGGGGPERIAPFLARVRKAWRAAGRSGEPRIAALTYFALGDDAEAAGHAYLADYYGAFAERLVLRRTADDVRAAVAAHAAAGVDELVFVPTVGQLAQVDRLAEAAL